MPDTFDFSALAEALAGISAGVPADGPEPGGIPHYFGDYLLEKEIARGGMGIVYRAQQVSLGRTVAVKVLREGAFAGGTEVERFKREAAAAARLRHPHIVGIHEIGESGGRSFFSMEYVAGPTLTQLLAGGPLPAFRAAVMLEKIAQAIEHAHGHGVLHRDLKPSNVLLDPEGGPMVTDFGLARQESAASGLTLSGQVIGTPAYMAPEQAEGRASDMDARTDVYGLGALLYHLLSGRPPFMGDSHLTVMRQVSHDEPVSLRALNPSVPPDLETICAKAMAKDPARRYGTAAALADDLQRFLAGKPVLARPIGPLSKVWRWAQRHRALAASVVSVFVLALAVALVATMSAGRLKVARDAEVLARAEAEANAWQTELNLYASDTATAWRNYQDGALEVMKQRLHGHVPAPGKPDPRGFEWYLLDRFSSGDQTRTLTLPGAAEDAAFSAEGQWVVVAGAGTARLLEAETGKVCATWPEETSRTARTYRQLAVLPGSTLLAAGSMQGLRLIDPKVGSVRILDPGASAALAFSGDGSRLAVANFVASREADPAHRVKIYRTADWSLEREWPMFCRGLAWNSAGELVVCDTPPGVPGRFSWLDPARDNPLRQFALNPGRSPVQLAVLNPKVDRFFLQLGNLEDCYGTLSTGNTLLKRGGSTMQQSAMDADAQQMVFTGEDAALRLWDLITGSDGPVRRGHTGRVLAVRFIHGRSGLRSVAADGTLRDWDLEADWQSPFGNCFGATALTGPPVLAPDSQRAGLLTGTSATGQDDGLMLRDLAGRKLEARLYAAPLAWSPDGAWLLAMRAAKVLAIHLPGMKEHVVLELPAAPAAWLPRVSVDWKWLAWTADGKTIRVTETTTGRLLTEVEAGQAAPAFSPDGRQLAIPRNTGLLLLDLVSGKQRDTSIPASSVVAWSPDGSLLASLSGTSVGVYETREGGKKRHEFSGHRGQVCSMAWTPDGRSLAVGCEDSTIHFWNLATDRDAFILPFHTRPFFMAFARDGSALIAGGTRGYRVLETALRLPVSPLPALAIALPDPAAGVPVAQPAPPPDPADDQEVIRQRLHQLWESAHIYLQKQGRWPDHLSALRDLLPEPMDRALMHPEAERTGGFFWQDDYTDPTYPSPFHYEWCAVLCSAADTRKDLSWKTDGPITQREYSERARARYGDKVPFIRCFVMHQEGELPAILYDGTLALLPDDWEKAYQTGWRPGPWK